MWKKLFKFRKETPKPELTPIDRLIELVGDEHLEVFNGVTYSGTRNETDGNSDKLDFKTTRWFKIKLGKYVSGLGDWGGGFDRACCPVVEVYVDVNDWTILRVCTPQPYYNSPNKTRDEELYKNRTDKVEENVVGEEYNQQSNTHTEGVDDKKGFSSPSVSEWSVQKSQSLEGNA
jgi:hypothetical protein